MKPKASSTSTAVITPPTIFRMFFILVGGFYSCSAQPVFTYRVPVRVPIGILLIVQALAVFNRQVAIFAFPRKRVNALCIFRGQFLAIVRAVYCPAQTPAEIITMHTDLIWQ